MPRLVVTVLALLVAAGALGVALEERRTRSDRESELRTAARSNVRTPTLTTEHAVGLGPLANLQRGRSVIYVAEQQDTL